MKRIIIVLGILTSLASIGYAQNEVDALRYSMLNPGGTARYTAMGGSFGALGADPSVLYFNPAGMGVYKSSDFSFSTGFVITNNYANFGGKETSDYDFNFNINNISYIGTIPVNNNNGLTSINIGFSYNRLNNFNENILIDGTNDYNSMTDWFAARANGMHYSNLYGDDNFYSNLAWESYLIDQNLPDTMSYVSAYYGQYGQNQKQFIYREGNQGEYNFALSANIMQKVFVGASMGLQSIRYEEVKTLQENDVDDLIADFNSFSFKEYLETRGSGINFKVGVLFAPTPWVRFGGSVHTPTFFDLNDNYYTSISSSFEDPNKSHKIDSYYGNFDYELTSPFKANASLGFIIAKQALINVDYEYVDYSLARLRSFDYGFFDENNNIRNEYKASHNVKLGLEYRFGPLAFRAGGAYYDTPYTSGHINSGSNYLVYSGGMGLRSDYMYFDVSYSYISGNNTYFMYEGYGVNSPATDITMARSRIVTTLGFKF
ncbi:MAG TPA: hypothetical protein PKN32_06715 [Bacteroidales bacterium]|nr:hypothetical protein [Bacteroidales bacterium]